MAERLTEAFARKRALLELEDSLLCQARTLYNFGFQPPKDGLGGISAAQMAAMGECIQRAESFDDARTKVGKFIGDQLKKLKKRADRNGKKISWLAPRAGSEESLGETLRVWIAEERYLKKADGIDDLDRLAALRWFWSYFHGLYRYQQVLDEPMVFPEIPKACDKETTP